LLDNATWVTKPPHSIGDLISVHLELERGFGYYQARGFVSKQVFNTLASDGRLTKDEYKDALRFELAWVHMLCTTPVDELDDYIHAFGEKVPVRLRPFWPREFFSTKTSIWANILVGQLITINTESHTIRIGKELNTMSFREIFQNREALLDANFDLQDVEHAYREYRGLLYKDTDARMSLLKTTFVHEDGTYVELVPQNVQGSDTAMPQVVERPVATDISVRVT